MTKKQLRKIYREKRLELSLKDKTKLDDLLLIQFQKLHLTAFHSLFCYWPIAGFNEPDTHLFSDFLFFKNPGLITAYPKINNDNGTMEAIVTDEATGFEPNAFGVMEPKGSLALSPEDIDVVLVPLLCFDKAGYRVGYGKGYYDRYLSRCRQDCLKIGLSYFDPVDEVADKHEFDVPLDLCVTPHATYVF